MLAVGLLTCIFLSVHIQLVTSSHDGRRSQEELIAALNSIDLSDPPAWLNPARQLQRKYCRSKICDNNITDAYAGIKMIACGTGQPKTTVRGRACFAIIIDGIDYMLFDVGMGAEIVLDNFNNTNQLNLIKSIFITHYHSDHTGGIGNALNLGFLDLRTAASDRVKLYGPGFDLLFNYTQGMRYFFVMDSINRQLQVNAAKKICNPTFANPTRPNLNPTVFDSLNVDGIGYTIPPFDNKTQITVVNNKAQDVVVKSFRVYHHSANPAVGYIILTKGYKIVISGDTVGYPESRAVVNAAKNADYLIHEVLNKTFLTTHSEPTPNGKFNDQCRILDSHTLVPQVARVAKLAKVKNLILTHIVPAPVTNEDFAKLLSAVQQIYKGNVYVSNDYDYWLLQKKTM
ncbi:unnamed protein product [Didymodactylos carnosus]|uniref:Metallo-beta-lactamase domain-containing protein n=1 Tax=Didymodactylos carnosus TaxID=1234261 RepID=A0A8S2SN02_9BILA|nr:unnamed protein product [Didymodactylos carnosus]CAF4235854.1 unnamed protein product [Didymodactylos carnosus]